MLTNDFLAGALTKAVLLTQNEDRRSAFPPSGETGQGAGHQPGGSTTSPTWFRLPIWLFSGENYRLKDKRRTGVMVKRHRR
jgi:hypothetical protein